MTGDLPEHINAERTKQRDLWPPAAILACVCIALCLGVYAERRRPVPDIAPFIQREHLVEARRLRDGERLNLNTATAEDLELLPRIGPRLSQRIVDARPFDEVSDLIRVAGIGERTLQRLAPLVFVGSEEQ